MIEVLFVCTANQCRSPMAAALLRHRLAERGVDGVTVASAGLLPGGQPATGPACVVVAGLDDHVSRTLTAELVAAADLVIGMTRAHVREAVIARPDALSRTFTYRDLVRRAGAVGPRKAGEDLAGWAARVSAGREAADLVGTGAPDDIDDPVGRPVRVYRRTAAELDELAIALAELAWP